MKMGKMEYAGFVKSILEESSSIASGYFGKVSAEVKEGDNNQVLTDADLAIGNFILRQISKTFPEHNIIDEEKGIIDNDSRYTWVVDPIDGTSNFASGSPLYGTLLGLLDNDQPIVGGASLPSFGEIYVAESGGGSFCNGEKISVSTEKNLLNSLVAYGIDGYQDDPERTRRECDMMAEIVLNIRNLRTSNSVFDSVMVAKGVYGVQLNSTSKIWDNVALQVIIEEAGGVYTDIDGNRMNYSKPLSRYDQNFTLACGALELHHKLISVVTKSR